MPSKQRIQTPHTTQIVANRSGPTVVESTGVYGSGDPSANRSLVGAKSDETSLLKRESLALPINYDPCSHCGTVGDARVILICASCRRPFCRSCSRKDAAGYWRCHHCARKVVKATPVPSQWIEETIKKQTTRAKADIAESMSLVRVIRCKCGRGVNTSLAKGIVDCACGARFRLADVKRCVTKVGAKTRKETGRPPAVTARSRPKVESMERFLKENRISQAAYKRWSGNQPLSCFEVENPLWTQRRWQQLVLENLGSVAKELVSAGAQRVRDD